MDIASDRFEKQLRFIVEIDRLKEVYRQTLLIGRSRRENSVEHSWHIGVMAILLSEHAKEENLDLCRVIKMVLVHDLVEIDAGDTYCYDGAGLLDQSEREARAAERIFGLLPEDQAGELRALWEEFEARITPEARFAAALDRFQPLLHNYLTDGEIWRKHGIGRNQVIERNNPIAEGAPRLWSEALARIDDAVKRGILRP
jgi:putative hydrolases of HD superfamily